MLRNGLYFVADRGARRSGQALGLAYRTSFILGALREDVIAVPGFGFSEYPSFSHFGGQGVPGGYIPVLWPGPRRAATKLFRRAQQKARTGSIAAAFVDLGRLAHVLADVSIPSHVHRVAHERDPFEWWVEGNLNALEAREVALPNSALAPAALVESMARRARAHVPDRTNTPFGRLLRRAGVWHPVQAGLARTQALELIPEAVAHTAAMLSGACSAFTAHGQSAASLVRSSAMPTEEEVLLETLDALDLPRRMLKPWFLHNRAFCEKHGGRRVYPGLLSLLDRCEAALEKSEDVRSQKR